VHCVGLVVCFFMVSDIDKNVLVQCLDVL
jgi:hypothetical protein